MHSSQTELHPVSDDYSVSAEYSNDFLYISLHTPVKPKSGDCGDLIKKQSRMCPYGSVCELFRFLISTRDAISRRELCFQLLGQVCFVPAVQPSAAAVASSVRAAGFQTVPFSA
jgi:hypothetical protein